MEVDDILYPSNGDGDHSVILFEVAGIVDNPEPIYKRNWRTYKPTRLVEELAKINWSFRTNDVQSYWDLLEERIVGVCDALIPYEIFVQNPNPLLLKIN